MSKLVPPYPTIRKELRQGRVIPFLGSGASLSNRTPRDAPWRHALDRKKDQWKTPYIPTASELASYLAEEAEYPRSSAADIVELTKAAGYFDMVNGRSLLDRRLQEIFNRDYPFSALHSYLADIPAPLLIVTTNYDDLMERAFRAKDRFFDLVTHTVDPELGENLLWVEGRTGAAHQVLAKDLDIDLGSVTVIYKMHGAVDRSTNQRGQFVITEDDYVDFLTRMTKSSAIPKVFGLPFQKLPFLFLGYGLQDWNLRVVLNRIYKEFRRPNDIVSWAIQRNPNLLEEKLWAKRSVQVFDQTIGEFVTRLKADGTDLIRTRIRATKLLSHKGARATTNGRNPKKRS